MSSVSNDFDYKKGPNVRWAVIFVVVIIAFLLFCASGKAQTVKQPAVYDTIQIDNSNIKKYCTITNKNGKEQTYAVLVYGETEELVSVSATVSDYIRLCKENGVKPSLALKLRNGQVSSIIRFKKKFVKNEKR